MKLKVNAKATENSQDISKRDDTRTKKEESGGGSKKENRKESKKDETANNPGQPVPSVLPPSAKIISGCWGNWTQALSRLSSRGMIWLFSL